MITRTLVALVVLGGGSAHAFSTGVVGYSGKTPGMTCNNCHSGGKAPAVTLSGPATLTTGEVQTYTLQIVADVVSSASMPADLPYSGFDVATSDGKIGQVSQLNQTRVLDNELSHTDKFPRANIVQVMFTLTAPMTAGPVTLYASGLSANGDGATTGDNSAQTTLALTVNAATVPPPPDLSTLADLSGVDLSGADLSPANDLAPAPPPDLAAPLDALSGATPAAKPVVKADLGPPKDEARWDCGCRVGGRAPVAAGPLAALLLLVPLLRRRRS